MIKYSQISKTVLRVVLNYLDSSVVVVDNCQVLLFKAYKLVDYNLGLLSKFR